jgi:hypothetical protein
MKFLIFILLLSINAKAFETECIAQVRDAKMRLTSKKVVIKDLLRADRFDGRYIKVVSKKNDEPLRVDSPLSYRACTVYYHLSKAREFFIHELDLRIVKKPRAVVTRIEMDQGFESSVHFLHENHGRFYNNALTIPPSGASRIIDKPWYYEIWFAPKKKVVVDNKLQRATDIVSSKPMMRALTLGVLQGQVTAIGQDFARGLSLDASYHLSSLALSLGVTAAVPILLNQTTKLIKSSIYLDTAMIPEVIYHEYSHFAFSQYLSISHSSAVAEGVANFYAAMIGKTDSLLQKTKGFSKGLAKVSAKGKMNYDYFMEDSNMAQLDFTFKFLYSLKEEFGKKYAVELVYLSLKNAKQDELKIKFDFIDLLKRNLGKVKSYQKGDEYRLIKIIQKFGF